MSKLSCWNEALHQCLYMLFSTVRAAYSFCKCKYARFCMHGICKCTAFAKCAKHNAWTVSQSPSRLNASWWGCETTMLEMLLLAWCMLTFHLLRKWTLHTRFPFQTEPFVLKRISCCFLAGQVPCQSYLSNKYPFKGRPGYRVDLPVMVGSLG